MFNKKLKEWKEKQAGIEAKMRQYIDTDENFYLTTNTTLNLAQKDLEIFESSEVSEKRQLLNFLLQNCKLRGKKLNFELKTPFDTVLQANRCPTVLPVLDAFRTVDWRKVKREIEPLRVMMNQNLATVNF